MDERIYSDGQIPEKNKDKSVEPNSYNSAKKNNSNNADTSGASDKTNGKFEVNIPGSEAGSKNVRTAASRRAPVTSTSASARRAPATPSSASARRAPANSGSTAQRRAPSVDKGGAERRTANTNPQRRQANTTAKNRTDKVSDNKKKNTAKKGAEQKNTRSEEKALKIAQKHEKRYAKATKKYEKALAKGKIDESVTVETFMLSRRKRKKLEKKAAKAQAKKKLTPEQIKKRKIQKRYNFVKGLLITCVCMIFITIMTVSVVTVALSVINDILVIDKSNTYSVTVNVPEEATTYDKVFNVLCENGLVKQRFLTDFFCKYRHYDTVEYEPGIYYFDSTDGIEAILETIMIRKDYEKDTIRLTFPEGWTVAQVFAKIEKYEVCEAQKLYANLDIIGNQYDFISDITAVEGRYLKAEGYLFPDTYDFYIGENASSVLKKLFNNFSTKWTADYDKKAKELGMTKDQIIKIASIIQREAKDSYQMGDVSAVIHNRLKDAETYPNLEMNSTKDYITGLKEYDLFSDFYYSLYIDTYNTYSSKGLPPGAICNPGIDAIEAALNPKDTPYLFFCHDTSGNIYLAETVDEHNKNTEEVLYGIEGKDEE